MYFVVMGGGWNGLRSCPVMGFSINGFEFLGYAAKC
jgi:hypothetical protein